jgi:hypothetical protein
MVLFGRLQHDKDALYPVVKISTRDASVINLRYCRPGSGNAEMRSYIKKSEPSFVLGYSNGKVPAAMLKFFAHVLLVVSGAVAAPVQKVENAAATVGKIRGVRDPIYHLYLQANSRNGMPSSFSYTLSFLISRNLPTNKHSINPCSWTRNCS